MNQVGHLSLRRVGHDVTIWPMAKIISPEVIEIADSVIIDDFVLLSGGQETIIGSFVHIASFASISGGGIFSIEDFAGISSGCRIFSGNDDYLGDCLTGPTVPFPFRVPIRSEVRIRKHAIIGANTVILPGVEIGEGAAIGANSLITKSCDPWTVYVGSPAKPIKRRLREKILQLENELRLALYDVDGRYIPKADRVSERKTDPNSDS